MGCWRNFGLFGTKLRSTHCREFNFLKLCRPAYLVRTTLCECRGLVHVEDAQLVAHIAQPPLQTGHVLSGQVAAVQRLIGCVCYGADSLFVLRGQICWFWFNISLNSMIQFDKSVAIWLYGESLRLYFAILSIHSILLLSDRTGDEFINFLSSGYGVEYFVSATLCLWVAEGGETKALGYVGGLLDGPVSVLLL